MNVRVYSSTSRFFCSLPLRCDVLRRLHAVSVVDDVNKAICLSVLDRFCIGPIHFGCPFRKCDYISPSFVLPRL